MNHQYRFGDVLIDPQSFRLLQGGKPLAIEPKALNVLIFLVQNQGRLIERRELLSAVWGDAFVTDHVLNRSIGQLRKVLGDDAKEPRYIETVPTLGYRFIAAVETETPLIAAPGAKSPAGTWPHDGPPATENKPVPAIQSNVSEPPDAIPGEERLGLDGPKPVVIFANRHRWLNWRLWIFILVGAVAIAAIASLPNEPRQPPPLESTQITSSTEAKERPIFTDGSRLYFSSRGEPSLMSVSGGTIVPMRALEAGLHLLDISADGSKVLAKRDDLNDETGGGSLWVTTTLGGTARKLGDHPANLAVWAPGGHSIVASRGAAVFGIDENGGAFTKLWDAPGPVTDLSFSPDGKQFCVTVELEYVSRIWIMRPDGTHAHLLAVEWPENQDLRNGRWTPDGRHFVFRSDGEGRQNMYEVVKPDWLHFWRKPRAVRLTGNQIEILASVPSRDAEGLFVLGRLDQGAMQVFDTRSKTLSPFLNGLSAQSFVVSPDRRWIAYDEYPSGNLWKSRVDGTGAVQLTYSVARFELWSPDGKALIYTDGNKLYRVSADGGPSEKLISTGQHEAAFTWSPDGRSIVFNYWDGMHKPDGLFVLDLVSRKVSPMADARSYYVPSWSPDGKFLVAIAPNPSRMMIFSAESKVWSVLKVFDVAWDAYVWSPDSRSIYMPVAQNRSAIYRIGVPDGSWEKVGEFDNLDAAPDESFVSMTSDGKPVIMRHTGVPQFYLLRWPK